MKSYSTEKQDRLLKIMQEAKGNSLDIYYVIYEEFLHNNETPSVLLPLILSFLVPLERMTARQKRFHSKLSKE